MQKKNWNRFAKVICSLYCLFLPALAVAAAEDISPALSLEEIRATAYLLNNISPVGARLGAVLASPSRRKPDYFYHWVRDAALTMDSVITLWEKAKAPSLQQLYRKTLNDYVEFSKFTQATDSPASLGEPKFFVDGMAYDGVWSRPQNDGPALRAISLLRFARILLQQGTEADRIYVSRNLYGANLPASGVVKIDLEYVAHHWRDPSYDLWEELQGDHFYTRIAQRRALLDGAAFAAEMQDPGARDFYLQEAQAITQSLSPFWDVARGYIVATRNPTDGMHNKVSNLDVAVILGALHSSRGDGFFDLSSEELLATAIKLESAFAPLYSINQIQTPNLGVAIGRYPEDLYNGDVESAPPTGNPWFLCTNAFAEFYYRAALDFLRQGRIEISETNLDFFHALGLKNILRLAPGDRFVKGNPDFQLLVSQIRAHGDGFLATTLAHMDQTTGAQWEQMNRENGFGQGARDLTWSYASFLSAKYARDQLSIEMRF